jgi:hypothetical protein
MECANKRGSKAVPLAHFTNCADRVNSPSTMLSRVGFGNVTRRDVHQELRPSDERGARPISLEFTGHEIVQPARFPKFLSQQGMEILNRELPKELIQTPAPAFPD